MTVGLSINCSVILINKIFEKRLKILENIPNTIGFVKKNDNETRLQRFKIKHLTLEDWRKRKKKRKENQQ